MKLTSIEIVPSNSLEKALLSFRDPGSVNPYNVKSIVGLDADAITPRYYKGSGDSSLYELSLENRDIIFKIGLNPNFTENKTYSDLRDDLYRMISSSRTGKVLIQFNNVDETVAQIQGFVSKFEAGLFEVAQEVQITISCDEPMLKSPVQDAVDLEIGPQIKKFVFIDEKSTAPHGFYLQIKPLNPLSSLLIFDEYDDSWSFETIPAGGFLDGDIINLSSEYNNKNLSITRGSATFPIADSITPGSVWPIIFPGHNNFDTDTDQFEWIKLWYYPTYWGV